MEERFEMVKNRVRTGQLRYAELFSLAQAEQVRKFHAGFPEYQKTPLVSMEQTARRLGLGKVWIKDESKRFGLNAFKVLGGSYAIGRYLAQRLGIDPERITLQELTAQEAQERLGKLTFVTATDGNHGRGIAWTARRLGQRAVVYMPHGSALARLENIRSEGAQAEITDYNYDQTVALARSRAEENDWILVQDTSWEGYEEIPARIMQGYCTMALEALEELQERPTHIFLQAGVGSMAGAMAGFFAAVYGKERPIITVVEPNQADCFFSTAKAADGAMHPTTGPMNTIMAGLACGEPCPIAWELLREYGDWFLSCPDYAAAQGMRILAAPARGDANVVAGESGASAFGCVAEIMTRPALRPIREKLELNGQSRVLFFNTEGDTDGVNYQRIVWDGAYAAPEHIELQ